MLTARSTNSSGLDLIRLALEILQRGSPVPHSLEAHFDAVVASARRLAADPANYPSADLATEVVRLAVEMRQHQDLMAGFDRVNRISDMNAVQAGDLLSRLERQPVPA